MKFWHQVPLLRLLIPFIIGVFIALSFDNNTNIPVIVFVICFVVCAIWLYKFKKIIRNYSHRWIFDAFVNLFIIFCAYQLTIQKTEKFNDNHFSKFIFKKTYLLADIIEPLVERENTFRAIVRVRKVKNNSEWIETSGKAMVYIQKSEQTILLNYGDKLLVYGDFKDVDPPSNPNEFNYKKYLSNRFIYQRAYIISDEWKKISSGNGNYILSLVIQLRDKFLKIFRDNNVSGKEYAVASALILGNTDKIDADLMKEYSSVGVMHILSVSGLHVGIVYLMMNFLLQFLDRFKHGKIIKSILLLLLIWLYALMTGLSPAVLRASTMFSFVIIGKTFNRYINIYNSLATSAFFLLLLNPYFLTDIGFQLSYLAVVGIVAIQPYISQLWYPQKWLLKQIWDIISISLAAQIATFPLSIYYFHQFPNYFIISNLIIIPLSNFVIYSGISVLLTFPFAWLSYIMSQIMAWLIKAMNTIIHFIETLPYSVFGGISISILEMTMLYVFSILLIYFLVSKKNKLLKYVLISCIVFELSFCFNTFTNIHQRKFIVYDIKKSSAIDFISGNQNILLFSNNLTNDDCKLNMYIINNWINMGINNTTKYPLSAIFSGESISRNDFFKKKQFIQFYDKRIIVLNNENNNFFSTIKPKVDYLILTDNINMSIQNILNQYNTNLIIMDASNSPWRVNKWINECEKFKINFYSVSEKGAFVITV